MKKQYLKILLYTLVFSPIFYFFWTFFLDENLVNIDFLIGFVIVQLLFLFLYITINRKVERLLYVETSKLIIKIRALLHELNLAHSSSDFCIILAEKMNEDFQRSQPLIYLKRDKNFVKINSRVDATKKFKVKKKQQKKISQLSAPENIIISIRSIKIDEVFDSTINEIIETQQITHVASMSSNDDLIGIAFVNRNMSKLFYDLRLHQKLETFFSTLSATYQKSLLFDKIQRNALENKILLDVGKDISSSLDLKTVLKSILDGVKSILDYDAAGIFLKHDNEEYLERLYTIGYNEKALDNYNIKQNQGVVKWVFEHKEPVAIPDVNEDNRYYNVRSKTKSQLTVPLFQGDELMGAFILEKDDLNYYTDDVINSSLTFAQQAAIAIVNAQLYQQSLSEKALKDEMINAGNIQNALLPKRPVIINNLEASIFNKPYKFVGGDIYDMYKFNADEMIFTIGDVSGKGSPASILMAVLFAGFRSLLRSNFEVSEYNARLNKLLYETTSSAYYATFFTGFINQKERELTYSNAGHNPPLLIRENNDVIELKNGGIVLGFLEEEAYVQEKIQLQNKDILVLFTDGLNEAFDYRDEEFGNERIIEIVQKNFDAPVRDLKDKIYDSVKVFHGEGKTLDDDITLIIMRFIYD